jgi:hypothetical protein
VGSHRSAATVWNVEGGDERLQEIQCLRWRRPKEPGLIVHESKALDARDVTVVDAIPVTTIERTLLDLGAVRHPLTVERAVETALRRELTTLPDLRSTMRRLGRRGRNGVGVLRRIIDERDPDLRIALEYESLAWHKGKEALIRDSARRNAVVAAGWLPISVTVEDLRTGGQRVCAQIRRVRARGAKTRSEGWISRVGSCRRA